MNRTNNRKHISDAIDILSALGMPGSAAKRALRSVPSCLAESHARQEVEGVGKTADGDNAHYGLGAPTL